jgi:hypothetical protein
MTRWTLIALAMLLGCGASSNRKTADYPDDVDSDPTETSGTKPAAANQASAKGDDEKGVRVTGGRDDAMTGQASGGGDTVAALQAVIDDEALEPYLHLDKPGRFPLVVAGSGVPEGLTKSSQPVKMGSESDGKDKAVLVFTEISVSGNQATVRYRYDVEGVKGSCTLVKKDGRWEIKNSRVTQH